MNMADFMQRRAYPLLGLCFLVVGIYGIAKCSIELGVFVISPFNLTLGIISTGIGIFLIGFSNKIYTFLENWGNQEPEKYFGIKNSCCTDDNIRDWPNSGYAECRTCLRLFILNERYRK